MFLPFRTLVICLLMLAVPAQGVMAATMAFCGTNHDRVGAVQATQSGGKQASAPAGHVHHGCGDATQPGQSDAPAESVENTTGLDDAAALGDVGNASNSSKSSDGSTQKCSACAACCSVAAILNSVQAVPAPVFTSAAFTAVVPSVDAFAAEGPDRPPRLVRA